MSLIPLHREEKTIPKFEDLIIVLFGVPKIGKTVFCDNCPNTLFISTEPGQDFIKSPTVELRRWQWTDKERKYFESQNQPVPPSFVDVVTELIQLKAQTNFPYESVNLDIVDNLSDMCRDYICAMKGLSYPPANDFGKTWGEITREWRGWIGKLMRAVPVRFISHCRTENVEMMMSNGMKKEVTRQRQSFSDTKPAQYLDGIVNSVGYVFMNPEGQRKIMFQTIDSVVCGDRTNILQKLGVLPLDWKTVSDAYREQAEKDGLKIRA